jgi:hypothetical protein
MFNVKIERIVTHDRSRPGAKRMNACYDVVVDGQLRGRYATKQEANAAAATQKLMLTRLENALHRMRSIPQAYASSQAAAIGLASRY